MRAENLFLNLPLTHSGPIMWTGLTFPNLTRKIYHGVTSKGKSLSSFFLSTIKRHATGAGDVVHSSLTTITEDALKTRAGWFLVEKVANGRIIKKNKPAILYSKISSHVNWNIGNGKKLCLACLTRIVLLSNRFRSCIRCVTLVSLSWQI